MQTLQLIPVLDSDSGEITWQDARGEEYVAINGLGSIWGNLSNAASGIANSLQNQPVQKNPGLFRKGGFFDNLISGSNGGIFRKKDGSNTVIGDTLNTFASSFGQRIGDNVVQQTTPGFNNQTFTPFNPGNLQRRDDTDNPLEEKDNTLLYVGIAGGILAVSGVIWYVVDQSKKKKSD